MAAEIMDLMIEATENFVTNNVDKWEYLKHAHKSTKKSAMRCGLIHQFNQILETIILLKETEYYSKYAYIRKVQSNEMLDCTFFREYYKEQRLTHLKPFLSWSRTSSHNSKKD